MVWPVCAVWCSRRTGPRRCISPVRTGTLSACGCCWRAARLSTRLRWVVQAPWDGTVGSACSGTFWCHHTCLRGWSGAGVSLLGAFGARCCPAHDTLEGVGSMVEIGCGTRVTKVFRRLDRMCGLCVPCGVADGRSHAAVYRLSERARGVRAGVVRLGRDDQPGEGGLYRLHDTEPSRT
jgi:hypothetical protein